MNGFKTLVLQDLTHVLPSKSLPISAKLPPCNLHTAAGSRRFWNFFEFASKDEIPTSEQCHAKDMIPPEQISCDLDEISKIAPTIPTVTAMTSTSINPRSRGRQQKLRESLPNCWNKPETLKEDSIMSLLDGSPVPKTMKWKLTGYKTLRRQSIDDFAFVPGGKPPVDVDFVTATTSKLPKSKSASFSRKPALRATDNEAPDDIITTTKAVAAEKRAPIALKSETAASDGPVSMKKESQRFEHEDPSNLTSSPKAEVENSAPEPGCASKIIPPTAKLSIPMAETIKFLPIPKPDLPIISSKHHQSTARYSSQPSDGSDKSQKAPQKGEQRSKSPFDSQDPEHRMETLPSNALPASPRQFYPAETTQSSWKTEAERDNRVYPAETAVNTASESRWPKQRLSSVPEVDLDVSQDRAATVPRSSSRQTEAGRLQEEDSRQFAPGAWRQTRPIDATQSRYQKQSDFKSMQGVYESMGIAVREGPQLNISAPEPRHQARTSPCAATQARMRQDGGPGRQQSRQARMRQDGGQQGGSRGFDGGSSMQGNGGGSKKPPAAFPPFTSRRASSSNSSVINKSLDSGATKSLGSKPAKVPAANISTEGAKSAPKERDECDQMIPGKEICTKPREDRCSRGRPDDCGGGCDGGCGRKSKKPCKRYCCPALQVNADCDWARSQCPGKQGVNVCNEKVDGRPKNDPTCLPPRPEDETCNFGRPEAARQACDDRRRCGRRENKCERRERSCDRQCSQRQSCSRERRSCERRERSCEKQEDRGQEAREICTKPRQRRSCERDREPSCERRRTNSCDRRRTNSCDRRRANSCDRDRGSAKCNRRNFTQSAHTRRPSGRGRVDRSFSMTALGFSMLGAKDRENKGSLFRVPMGRFYGKDEDPSCDKPASSRQVKCRKPPAKCLDKSAEGKRGTETKCKTETKCGTESKRKKEQKLCRTTCRKAEKKESCASEASDGDRCAKRRQQICKSARSSAEKESESAKDRVERELKEIQNCKKHIGGRDKGRGKGEKRAEPASGLQRAVSPCKRRSSEETSGCGKTLCAPTNRIPGAATSLFVKPENDFTCNTVPDRLFSSATWTNRADQFAGENEPDFRRDDHASFASDDSVFADSGAFTGIPQRQEHGSDDVSMSNNWFLSWFQ
ncbi:uncharacterized protein LOC117221200 isoform X1 [Megalopta genalis]|uniref:uncharacterized protein LOC117221200 isoform X1 n=1 Tax=Megalopta genalis TaxID=115081 RepID=UPI003FD185A6